MFTALFRVKNSSSQLVSSVNVIFSTPFRVSFKNLMTVPGSLRLTEKQNALKTLAERVIFYTRFERSFTSFTLVLSVVLHLLNSFRV